MAGFVVLQLVFDAVLLFALLFLFNYTVGHAQRKKDDDDLLKSLEVEEIKQDLQELLITLKQVGSEASENIQRKVKDAEAKSQRLKDLLKKVENNLSHISRLSDDVSDEKERLDEKWKMMQAARLRSGSDGYLADSSHPDSEISNTPTMPKGKNVHPVTLPDRAAKASEGAMGPAVAFSSEAVKEIYRLADASVDVSEIARRTKLTRGEVQLILNLRTNRFTTPN